MITFRQVLIEFNELPIKVVLYSLRRCWAALRGIVRLRRALHGEERRLRVAERIYAPGAAGYERLAGETHVGRAPKRAREDDE